MRPTRRRPRQIAFTAGIALVAVAIGGIVYQANQAGPSSAALPGAIVGGQGAEPASGKISQTDGLLPESATVFDEQYPGIAKLDSDLLDALRKAGSDAGGDGVEFTVNSGWRSARYQDQLLADAVADYGSEHEAARWVATAQTSPHVSGHAVDMGAQGAAWLSEQGSGYGLCQIYDNEPWHYELRAKAIDQGCPGRYADPSQDPRLR